MKEFAKSKESNKESIGNNTPSKRITAYSGQSLYRLQKVIGNQAVLGLLQTNLRISQPYDACEHEADSTAEDIMRMTEPSGAQKGNEASGALQNGGTPVLRKQEGSSPNMPDVPPVVQDVLSSPGKPLDNNVRAFMEPRFGVDFSEVRVHSDAKAAKSAKALNATAYTVGNDIIFAQGSNMSNTESGKMLFAHELAHVVQQKNHGSIIARKHDGTTDGKEGTAKCSKITVYLPGLIMFYGTGGVVSAYVETNLSPGKYHVRFDENEERIIVVGAETDRYFNIYFNPQDTQLIYDYLKSSSRNSAVLEVKSTEELLGNDKSDGENTSDDGKTKQGVRNGSIIADEEYEYEKERNTTYSLNGDLSVLSGDANLAGLYLQFLARYAGINAPQMDLSKGLSEQEVQKIIKGNAAADVVTRYFTQGWNEYKAIGRSDMYEFAILEEALLNQWTRKNKNVINNCFDIRSDDTGLGLFLRNTPLKYYDNIGMPVVGFGGNYRDTHFSAYAPLEHSVKLNIKSKVLQHIFAALKQESADDTYMAYKAAMGYVENGDIFAARVMRKLFSEGTLNKVSQEFIDQLKLLLLFLAGHSVALVLSNSKDIRLNFVGKFIDILLKLLERFLLISFVGGALITVYRIGLELSMIERTEDGKGLDPISDRHLENAASEAHELIVMLLAAGLTVKTIKKAKSVAQVLGDHIGKGGPPGLQPAPAAIGNTGKVRLTGGEAAAAGGPENPFIPSWVAPLNLDMFKMEDTSGDKKAAGNNAGRGSSKPGKSKNAGREIKEPTLPNKKASIKKRVEFLLKHRELLGPVQRKKFDELRSKIDRLSAKGRKNAELEISNWEDTVESKLKEVFCEKLSKILGFKVKYASRIPETEAGFWEKINTFIKTGRKVKLSITCELSDGELIQIDGYNPKTRSVWENKDYGELGISRYMSRAARSDAVEFAIHKLAVQMEKHARFAEQNKLKYFEWDVPPDLVNFLVDNVLPRLPQNLRGKIKISHGMPNMSDF